MSQKDNLKKKIETIIKMEAYQKSTKEVYDDLPNNVVDIVLKHKSELKKALQDKIKGFQQREKDPRNQNEVSKKIISIVLRELLNLDQIVEFENLK